MGLRWLVGVVGLGWREFGLFSGDLGRSVRLSEVFRLNTEKAGTDIGLVEDPVSFLVLRVVSGTKSSSGIVSGLGPGGGKMEDVGTDMERDRSPRDSNMSSTPSLTAEDCLLYWRGLGLSSEVGGGDWDLTGWNQAGDFLLGLPTCSEVCRPTCGGVILRHLCPGDIGLRGGGEIGRDDDGDIGLLASGGSGGLSLTS